MSDLIFAFRRMSPISQACAALAPASGADPCSIIIPLREEGGEEGSARRVRFDRQGDQFVLSPANGGDILTWAGSHGNLPVVLSAVRVLYNLTLGTDLGDSTGEVTTLAVLAHYITTGEVMDSGASTEEGRRLLASAMLDILTDSPEDALSALLGRLSVLRGQDWLNAEARERVRWIIEMTDLVPQYRNFRQHFLNESDFVNWRSLSAERRGQVEAIATFSRSVVLSQAFDHPLRYSGQFRAAEAAYQALHVEESEGGSLPDFCAVLEGALRELRGERGLPRNFLEDCRLASRLVDSTPLEAARATLRHDSLSAAGLRRLQDGVEAESRSTNMRIEWLAQQGDATAGGRIGEVLAILLSRLLLVPADEAEMARGGEVFAQAPRLGLEVAPLIVSLNIRIDAQTTRRREYIIAALALMRRLFPESGNFPPVRALIEGEFQELHWQFSDEDRRLLRQFLRSLGSRIEVSQDTSELTLPLIEGGVCLLGAGGLLATHLIPQVGDHPDLQLGLGTASAALAGAGCTALIGHFLWPAITDDVHNRYLWEGLTGLGGALLSGGLYFLFSFLGRDESGPMPQINFRFPVDMYGP